MTYRTCLWEIYLEELKEEKRRDGFGINPEEVRKNLIKLIELSREYNIPTLRNAFVSDAEENLWLDERKLDEYYGIFIFSHNPPYMAIKPEKFRKESVIRSLKKDGIKNVILCGCSASQCVTDRTESLYFNFNVIIVKDAIYDRTKKDYECSLKRFEELDAEILTVKELENRLKKSMI